MRTYKDTFATISPEEIIPLAQRKKDQGSRFVEIHANTVEDGFELNYAYTDDDVVCDNYMLTISKDTKIPSISGIFLCAFFFENETHDLFGIDIEGIAIDFKGNFYQTAIKYPMAHETTPEDMYSVNDRLDAREPVVRKPEDLPVKDVDEGKEE